MTTEIIVYRNPLEQAFWNGLMDGGPVLFPIIMAIVVGIAVLVFVDSWVRKYNTKRYIAQTTNRRRQERTQFDKFINMTHFPLALGALAAVLTGWYLWI